MNREEALEIARAKWRALKPHIDRCEIAGSIRRGRKEVKDIELVVIPKMETVEVDDGSLFAVKATVTRRVPGFAETVRGFGEIITGKEVKRYTKIALPEGINLDLFTATPDNWGLIYMIRTGSAEFSHQVLLRGNRLGWKSVDGMWHHKGKAMPMRTEEEVFAAMRMRMPEPEQREAPKDAGPEFLKPFIIF